MSFPNFALHNIPVDRVASRLAFGESEAWEPKRKPANHETFDCPPLALMDRPKDAPDYSGMRRGRLVAFRYHTSGKHGSQWLCRCDCGKYEIRNAGRWAKNLDQPDQCEVCRVTFYSSNGFQINGFRPKKERAA